MSVQELSILYNAVFIVILICVCIIFSMLHLKIGRSFTRAKWLFTTIYFVVVCFTTITLWYFFIGFSL